jgi:hypothetical protein
MQRKHGIWLSRWSYRRQQPPHQEAPIVFRGDVDESTKLVQPAVPLRKRKRFHARRPAKRDRRSVDHPPAVGRNLHHPPLLVAQIDVDATSLAGDATTDLASRAREDRLRRERGPRIGQGLGVRALPSLNVVEPPQRERERFRADRLGLHAAVSADPRVPSPVGVVEQLDACPPRHLDERVGDASPLVRNELIAFGGIASGEDRQTAVTAVTAVTLVASELEIG